MNQYKANIKITLRKGILDVQGKAVEHALHSIDFKSLTNVRIGKYVELIVEAENPQKAKEIVRSASEKLIANPIIEDFDITIYE
ncbi:phosphoribosylformylglycinamidine synthase subunit PurS [Bacteroidetes/Chlorobi group bacterium ChocPot_Mid]|jgi:phosphoribosylformylglycinamidine synthase|nr:MAG: phosphoribosylformylglycinamidine synthase subunit PurS [Bacteroidetes/Chlorobi group bacterium ChocPot_Mid]